MIQFSDDKKHISIHFGEGDIFIGNAFENARQSTGITILPHRGKPLEKWADYFLNTEEYSGTTLDDFDFSIFLDFRDIHSVNYLIFCLDQVRRSLLEAEEEEGEKSPNDRDKRARSDSP